MATMKMPCAVGTGGGGSVSFVYLPGPYNSTYLNTIIIPTENISHFKSAYNSAISTYAHTSDYKVGYLNTLPSSDASWNGSTSDAVELNNADFDVNKSYTYLIVYTLARNTNGRAYDITLTI